MFNYLPMEMPSATAEKHITEAISVFAGWQKYFSR